MSGQKYITYLIQNRNFFTQSLSHQKKKKRKKRIVRNDSLVLSVPLENEEKVDGHRGRKWLSKGLKNMKT